MTEYAALRSLIEAQSAEIQQMRVTIKELNANFGNTIKRSNESLREDFTERLCTLHQVVRENRTEANKKHANLVRTSDQDAKIETRLNDLDTRSDIAELISEGVVGFVDSDTRYKIYNNLRKRMLAEVTAEVKGRRTSTDVNADKWKRRCMTMQAAMHSLMDSLVG